MAGGVMDLVGTVLLTAFPRVVVQLAGQHETLEPVSWRETIAARSSVTGRLDPTVNTQCIGDAAAPDAVQIRLMHGAGMGPSEIARRLGVARSSVYRRLGRERGVLTRGATARR